MLKIAYLFGLSQSAYRSEIVRSEVEEHILSAQPHTYT